MRQRDGELILFWTLPVVAIIWVSAFLLFPGFLHPMSPTMSAEEVAGFYRDETARIRYSMILFNWFGVGLIPIVILLAMQIRRMAHRTPILSYSLIACAGGPPTIFLIANLFWLLAAFRPERDPELTQLFNDLAWVTFTIQVRYLIAQCVFLALAIYLDRQERPVFKPWVAHFNLLVAAALVPAAFAALAMTGPFAWDGLLSFWVKNIAIGVWIVVMGVVLGQTIRRQRAQDEGGRRMSTSTTAAGDDAGSTRRLAAGPARLELSAPPQARVVVRLVGDGRLLQPVRPAVLRRHARPAAAEPRWDTPTVVQWFDDTTIGLLVGFAVVFLISGMCAPMNAMLAYSMRRMSVSRAFAYSYLVIYALAAVPGMLVMGIALTVGAMRPDRDPELISWLYDFAFLSFSGTMGVFLIGSLVWMVAILLDKNRVFPEVVRLPQPLQRADRSRRRARVDLPARRLRVERRDRVVDQHGRVRHLHGRLPHAAAEDDPARRLRHRAVAGPPGKDTATVGFGGGGTMTNLAGAHQAASSTTKPTKFVPGQPDMWVFVLFESLLFTGYFSVYLVSRTQNRGAVPAVPGGPGSARRGLQHPRPAAELVGHRTLRPGGPRRARTGPH